MLPDGIFLARSAHASSGRRLAVKDLFDTAGLVTTYGSLIFAEHVPAETAPAVSLLEHAGYVMVGKTNLHEFAYGVTSQNPHFGTVPNPAAPGRLAGGSSGGNAAALAAGLADVALGSDSGGSIRIPSAWCGTVGFKPTYGRVAIERCFPLAPSFDHVGPMGRSVAACAEAMAVLAPEPDTSAVDLSSLDDVAVGVAWTEHAQPLVRARVEAAAALFPHRRPIQVPFPDGVASAFDREVAEVHAALYPEHADEYGDDVRRKLERCFEVTDREYEAAARRRADYREQVAAAVADLDLLVTPTVPFVAPRADVAEREIGSGAIRFTYPFNALGWPALALPCGSAEEGLAASVQVAGPSDRDGLVLAAGALLEEALAEPG